MLNRTHRDIVLVAVHRDAINCVLRLQRQFDDTIALMTE